MKRRIFQSMRILGLSCAGLLAAVLLALAAGLIFLRTTAGEQCAVSLASKTLEAFGIHMEIQEFSGPLPLECRIRNIRLSDSRGQWFRADSAAVKVRFIPLLCGRTEIDFIRIKNAVLSRYPVLVAQKNDGKNTEKQDQPGSLQDIAELLADIFPCITLDGVAVENIMLDSAVSGAPLTLSLCGKGEMSNWIGELNAVAQMGESTLSVNGPLRIGLWSLAAPSEAEDRYLKGIAFRNDWNIVFQQRALSERIHLKSLGALRGEKATLVSLDASSGESHAFGRDIGFVGDQLQGILSVRIHASSLSDIVGPLLDIPVLPFLGVSGRFELSGTLKKPQVRFRTDIRGLFSDASAKGMNVSAEGGMLLDISEHVAGRLSGTIAVEPGHGTGEQTVFSVQAEAWQHGNDVMLKAFNLDSEVLRCSGQGQYGTILGGSFSINLPSLEKIANLPAIQALPQHFPLRHIAGSVSLKAEANQLSREEYLKGSVVLQTSGMTWGDDAIDRLLGSHMEAKVALLADVAGKSFFSVEKLLIDMQGGVGLKADGRGKIVFARDGSPLLDACKITAAVDSLDGLGIGILGKMSLAAEAEGALSSPRFSFHCGSPLISWENDYGRVRLHAFALDASGTGQQGSGSGQAELSVRHLEHILSAGRRSQKNSVSASADWHFSPQSLSLNRIVVKFPGLVITGKDIVASSDFLSCSGRAEVDIQDWTALSAVSGADLSGKPAKAEIILSNKQGQNAEIRWTLSDLQAFGVKVTGQSGQIAFHDMFGKGELQAFVNLGSLFFHDFGWNTGKIAVRGSSGDFELSVLTEGTSHAEARCTMDVRNQTVQVDHLQADTLVPGKKNVRVGFRADQPFRFGFGQIPFADKASFSLLRGGKIQADGSLNAQSGLIVLIQDFPLETIRLVSGLESVPNGGLHAEINVKGSAARPDGHFRIAFSDVHYADSNMEPVSLKIQGKIVSSVHAPYLSAEVESSGFGDKPARGFCNIPLYIGGSFPEPDMKKTVRGQFSWNGHLDSFWQFLPLPDSRLDGKGSISIVLNGTLDRPKIRAQVKISDADYRELIQGIEIMDIDADISFDSEGKSSIVCSAGDGKGGRLLLSGSIGGADQDFPLNISGKIHSLAPLHRNDVDVMFSGDLALSGKAKNPHIRVNLNLDRGSYDIQPLFGTSIPELEFVQEDQHALDKEPLGPEFDIHISIPRFFARGAGLASEWKGDIQILGKAKDPQILGKVNSVKGDLDLLGRSFNFRKGEIVFTGSADPILNMSVDFASSHITAEALIGGRSSKPEILLRSIPPLPRDEIVSQILFNRSSAELGRTEALQLATSVANLATMGIGGRKGVIGETRDALGLDVLRMGSGSTGSADEGRLASSGAGAISRSKGQPHEDDAPTLEAGKYITKDIYIGLEQGMTGEDSGVRIEIEVMPRLNVTGKTSMKGSEVGVSWKKDY
ncbi:MAG: translocation/assembly module TamB [Desulfovibrionaceae bacterium]|nr:translocation/assembly module TamB [Desulfovibrionaceae bacterium]